VLSCSNGALYQVAYTFNVQGSVADGTFIPASPVGESSNCPDQISYLPKQLNTEAQATSGYC
jgi:ribonuclease T2